MEDNLDYLRTPAVPSTNPDDNISDNDAGDDEFAFDLATSKNPNPHKYYRYNQTPYNKDGNYRHRRPHSPKSRDIDIDDTRNKNGNKSVFHSLAYNTAEIEQFLKTKKKLAKPNAPQVNIKHSISTPDFKTLEELNQLKYYSKSKPSKFATIDTNRGRIIRTKRKRDILRNFLKADLPLTTNSFPLCPHPHHCAQNAVFKGLIRTFGAAYVFKTSIALSGQLFGGKIVSFNGKNRKNIFGIMSINWSKIESIFYDVDTLRFSQFVSLASCTYKALLCMLRRWRLQDPIYHKTIAGFIAGLWILRDSKNRRKTLALYCMVRMLGDWIKLIQYSRTNNKNNNFSLNLLFTPHNATKMTNNTKTTTKTKKNKKNKTGNNTRTTPFASKLTQKMSQFLNKCVKYSSYIDGEVFTFTVAQVFIMYAAMHAPFAIDSTYYRWIKNMGKLSEPQIQMTMRSRIDKNAMYRLSNEVWLPCYSKDAKFPFHKSHSCLYNNIIDFFGCLARATRMYLPVHLLPMLLFTPKIVFNSPITFIKLKLWNTLRSAIFLSVYVFNMKQTVCFLRNLFKTDNQYISFVGGFMAGLSILFEHSKRRIELCLYVIPRAIEILFRLISKNKFSHVYKLLRWNYLPVISFALAISGWMTLIAVKNGTKCANGLNMTVLRVVFGSLH